MNRNLKIMALVLCTSFLVILFFWQKNSQEDFLESGVATKTSPQETLKKTEIESHARDSELPEAVQKDFGPDLSDEAKEEESVPNSQDFDALETLFEEVEQEWHSKMERLIRQDLGLSDEAVERYHELRDDYDEAKLMAFEDYHQKMIDQHGEDYAFNPSVQMEDFDNNVLPQYLKQLEKLIGQEGVRKYTQMKDEFNQEIREEGHPGAALILIDF